MKNIKRTIADFETYYVIITNNGYVRAGVNGVMSKDYPEGTLTYNAIVDAAERATCDEDLEDLFIRLDI